MTTVKDIASLAGCSIATVSKALNGYSDVSEKTKKKIVDIAERMNYYPDYQQKNLKCRDNDKIALILNDICESDIGSGNAVGFIKGVYGYALSIGYDLVVHITDHFKQESISYYQYCKKQNIVGAIVEGVALDEPYFAELIDSNLPFVLKDIVPRTVGRNMGVVTTDNYRAAYEAVAYLLKSGHTKIGLMSGRKNAQVSNIREQAYRDALLAEGTEVKDEYIVYGEFKNNKAKKAAIQLLHESPELTAVFCLSDMMAVGVMEACKEMDKRVPDDLSIIGFDDIPMSRFLDLTTVRQDWVAMGHDAGELLVEMIHHETDEHARITRHELIIRDSVKIMN